VATLYTVGHSTRTLPELIEVLQAHSIKALFDIRAFPMSRRLPHFNRETLEQAMPEAGIGYRWLKELGGFRKKSAEDSPNPALRNASFRNFADYMLTAEFRAAVDQLSEAGERVRAAYMCAERLYFRCHRMLVSDWLVAHGHRVFHIEGAAAPRPHSLTPEARLIEGRLLYIGDRLPL
jgi:uncharacterized protein (DUF488 family)